MTVAPRSRLPLRLAVVAALAALALAGCRPGGDGASTSSAGGGSRDVPPLNAAVEVTDPAVGGGAVTVTVREGEEPVSGAVVAVQADMTHAGMAPVIADATEAEPGVYRTDEFAFTMAGDWIVTAEVRTQDGRTATAETFVTVAR
jgi:hypothetical protein